MQKTAKTVTLAKSASSNTTVKKVTVAQQSKALSTVMTTAFGMSRSKDAAVEAIRAALAINELAPVKVAFIEGYVVYRLNPKASEITEKALDFARRVIAEPGLRVEGSEGFKAMSAQRRQWSDILAYGEIETTENRGGARFGNANKTGKVKEPESKATKNASVKAQKVIDANKAAISKATGKAVEKVGDIEAKLLNVPLPVAPKLTKEAYCLEVERRAKDMGDFARRGSDVGPVSYSNLILEFEKAVAALKTARIAEKKS